MGKKAAIDVWPMRRLRVGNSRGDTASYEHQAQHALPLVGQAHNALVGEVCQGMHAPHEDRSDAVIQSHWAVAVQGTCGLMPSTPYSRWPKTLDLQTCRRPIKRRTEWKRTSPPVVGGARRQSTCSVAFHFHIAADSMR